MEQVQSIVNAEATGDWNEDKEEELDWEDDTTIDMTDYYYTDVELD